MAERFSGWLAERLHLEPLAAALRHKTVPQHRYSIWYYFGGMTLFLFAIQAGTGALLLLYYRPSAGEAYESVQFIMTRVPFGWLIRSIHAWSANLMVAGAFAHMFSVLFLKAYRRPREITWVSGAGLLFLTLGFGFTGYLLPWNELSYFATRVGTEVGGAVPVVGEFSVRLLRGGRDVTGATLTRFFGIHVAILPAITFAVLALHLWLIQAHGMSLPPSVEHQVQRGARVRSVPFVPHFALRELFGWTVVLALLGGLSALMPWELGKKADLFAPAPAGIRPEWYFLWTFQTLKYMPARVLGVNGELLAIAAFGIGAAALVALPFLDRNTPRSRRAVALVAAMIVVFMIAMTMLALQAEPK